MDFLRVVYLVLVAPVIGCLMVLMLPVTIALDLLAGFVGQKPDLSGTLTRGIKGLWEGGGE